MGRLRCIFTVTVFRKPPEELDLENENEPDNKPINLGIPKHEPENEPEKNTEHRILEVLGSHPDMSYDDLARFTRKGRSTIMRHIARLKASGRLKRVGPKKGGRWEILE